MGPTVAVAAMFVDMVGSTLQASALGPERAEAVRRRVFGAFRSAVAEAGGSEVKTTGDGVMVVFTSAGSALDGAVLVQRHLQRSNQLVPEDERVRIRVGVAFGDATIDRDDYFGEPIVEAARLCDAAGADEIWVSDVVAMMVRSGPHTVEQLGQVELKGLTGSRAVARVPWAEPEGTNLVPLPAAVTTGLSAAPHFVGRETELSSLDRAWKAASNGERTAALISGEPGVGKTTLLSTFAAAAHGDGGVVLHGRADDDLGVPYLAWRGVLEHLVEHVPQDLLDAHVEVHGGGLARVAANLRRRVPDAPIQTERDAEVERLLLFQSVTALLASVSAHSPVLILLEDLHWADAPTLSLLKHVVSESAGARIMVLLTFRDTEVDRDHPLLEVLSVIHRHAAATRIPLGGLDDLGVVQLMEALAGHALDERGVGFAHAVRTETDGNPYFVSEIIRDLTESGQLVRSADGRWRAADRIEDVRVPLSVREVVGQRIARLGRQARDVLDAASIVGRDFDIDLIAGVTGASVDEVLDALDLAVGAHLVEASTVPDRFTFTHALVQHVLADGLGPARSRQLHRRVAAELEVAGAGAAGQHATTIAHHWLAATVPVDPAKAIHYARLAGDEAVASLAPDEAVRWYRSALDLLDPAVQSPERCSLLVALGTAQRQMGDPAHRETLLRAGEEAVAIGDAESLVAALVANTRWFAPVGAIDEERVAQLRRAIVVLGDEDSAAKAQILAELALELHFAAPMEERLRLGEEAVEVARRVGEPRALLFALIGAYYSLNHPSTLRLRGGWLDEAWEIVDDLDDPMLRYLTASRRLLWGLEAVDRDVFDEAYAVMEEEAERLTQPLVTWEFEFRGVVAAMLDGDIALADARAARALELGIEMDQPDAFARFGSQWVQVRLSVGDFAEIVPAVEKAYSEQPRLRAYAAVAAWAYAQVGRIDDARRTLEQWGPDYELDWDGSWSVGESFFAQALCDVGDREGAAVMAERLAPYGESIATTGLAFFGIVAHHLGCLTRVMGDHDAADRHFDQAVEIARRMRAPYLLAEGLVEWARLDVERGGAHRQHAKARLEEASGLIEEYGFRGLAERAATFDPS